MRKLKHSKYKNPSILFELLSKQMTSDILQGKPVSEAYGLVGKYFSESTELGKEYKIYQTISEASVATENQADRILSSAIASRKKLNEQKLAEEKYALIGEIKESYDLTKFLCGEVKNYKLLASIYKVMEESVSTEFHNPSDIIVAKNCITESIVKNSSTTDVSNDPEADLKMYLTEDRDVRLLAYKNMLDTFNSKYQSLYPRQSALIREYVKDHIGATTLKSYIILEVSKIKEELRRTCECVDEPVIKIKIQETANQLDGISAGNSVKDNQVVALLNCYELLEELHKINKAVL